MADQTAELTKAVRNVLLDKALREDNLRTAIDAVRDGADINVQTSDGVTILMLACFKGNIDIVKGLLDVPTINLNATRWDGMTALMIAIQLRHFEIAELLLEKGADTFPVRTRNPFDNAMMIAMKAKPAQESQNASYSRLLTLLQETQTAQGESRVGGSMAQGGSQAASQGGKRRRRKTRRTKKNIKHRRQY